MMFVGRCLPSHSAIFIVKEILSKTPEEQAVGCCMMYQNDPTHSHARGQRSTPHVKQQKSRSFEFWLSLPNIEGFHSVEEYPLR
jgi:hypothetical protein